MTKHLALVLRLGVVAAGITYIVWTLTWQDQVVFPAGYGPWADGRTLDEPMAMRILARDEDTFTVEPPADSGLRPFKVEREELGTGAGRLQYQPGIVTTLRDAHIGLLAIAFLLIGLMFPIQAVRWLILMRCRGLAVSPLKALRLLMVGLFFSFFMPGLTGGDVVKAYYAAKGSGRRGTAVMSIVFDRCCGIFGLLLLAGCVGLTMLDDPLARQVTIVIWVGFAMLVVLAMVYFSGRLRRRLGFDQLLKRMPGNDLLARIDRAAVAYRHHRGPLVLAVLVSIPAHVCQIVATSLAGFALGITTPLGILVIILPVVIFVGAVPITFLGVGTMEPVAVAMLGAEGIATKNQIVGMLVLYRLFMVGYALLSSLVVLRGDIHLFPQEASPPPADPE